jgi:4-amino-4-deoxy-L-arabinose transferase-like glycosyltransferase
MIGGILKNNSNQKTSLLLLVLGLIALAGCWMLKVSTPFGLGLSNDSIAYIAGARAILRGQGYSQIWLGSQLQPITHFPPLLSSVLALISLSGLDPLRGARLLNILLFGGNTVLLGIVGWRMTHSRVAGAMLSFLFISNSALLRVHSYILSEPLYLFISLAAFLLFAIYIKKKRTGWLVGTGCAVGLAYLTRYAGLALLATLGMALVFLQNTGRKRITSLLVFFGSACPWLLAWMIRNKILAGNITNRTIQWHPITPDNLQRGIYNFSRFFIPIEDWRRYFGRLPGFIEGILLVIGLGMFAWLVITGLKLLLKPTQIPQAETLRFTNGLYIFGYLGSLLVSLYLFDASTPLKERILSPVYVSMLILLIAVGVWVWKLHKTYWRIVVLLVFLWISGISLFTQIGVIHDLKKDGQGYASWQWNDSEIMEAIRRLPNDIMVYTNQTTAVYIWTDRSSLVLPNVIDPVTLQPFSDYQQGLEKMKRDILQGKAVMVIFNSADTEDPVFQENLDEITSGLYLAQKSQGDAIYTAQP